MKTHLRVWISFMLIWLLLVPMSASSLAGPWFSGEETEENSDVPPAVLQGAKKAWADMCSQYGQISLVNYDGEIYLDEGNGAAIPLMSKAEGNYFLVVLLQQDETLIQIVFRIDEDGAYKQVLEDHTLILGERAALFLYEESGGALIALASLGDDLAAFAAIMPQTMEKRLIQGDETAESIADMGVVPWEAFEALYGSPEWSVRVDANYGLFHIQFSEAQHSLGLFHVTVP